MFDDPNAVDVRSSIIAHAHGCLDKPVSARGLARSSLLRVAAWLWTPCPREQGIWPAHPLGPFSEERP